MDEFPGRTFGQFTPPLITFLKDILDKYPEGGQIIKEVIQNADDAGATEVKFVLDTTEYGRESLLTPTVAEFQGEALYCYNNAEFSDDDWKSIQSVQQSVKKQDPMKVGRFGLGFVSVYHLTDMPSVMSSDQIGFFDPFEWRFGQGKSGTAIPLDEQLFEKYHDQYAPFSNILGIGKEHFSRKYFKGSLFRFPLRQTASKLSSTVFTADRVRELFDSFKEDADLTLLFLKNVTHISFFERTSPDEEMLVFEVKNTIDNMAEREEFLKELSHGNHPQPYVSEHCVEIQNGGIVTSKKWLVLNKVFEDVSSRMTELSEKLKLLPWIGLAMPIQDEEHEAIEGRVFCFLPLPPCEESITGFPVHIHGYFGLSDNRRSIKWPAADQRHDPTAEWNQLLVQELLPKAYSMVIVEAIQRSVCPSDVYKAWPMLDRLKAHWSDIREPFIESIASEKVLHTQADGGKWIYPNDALLDTLRSKSIEPDVEEAVRDFLLKHCQQKVVSLPENVMNCISNSTSQHHEISPSVLRNCVREYDVINCSKDVKTLLLKYCLHDKDFGDLDELRLLPVSTGSHEKFSSDRNVTPVLMPTNENPKDLLPNLSHAFHFVDTDLPLDLINTLQEVAQTRTSQLRYMKESDVVEFIFKVLPQEWFSVDDPIINWTPGKYSHPPEMWVETFWLWLQHHFQDISAFNGLPIIPVNMTGAKKQLLKLDQKVPVIGYSANELDVSDDALSCLKQLGVIVLSKEAPFLSHPSLKTYIQPATPNGLLNVLSKCDGKFGNLDEATAKEKHSLRHVLARVNCLSDQEKNIVRELPIFDIYPGCEEFRTKKFTYLGNTGSEQSVAPFLLENQLPKGTRLRRCLISSNDPDSQCLMNLLDEEPLKLRNVMLKYILPDIENGFYQSSEVDTLMVWILRNLSDLIDEDPEFASSLKHLAFVTTASDKRAFPSELFDPEDNMLKDLLEGEDVFPVEPYSQPQILSVLRNLGMKRVTDLMPSDLLNTATCCQSDNSGIFRVSKATALLQYINNNSGLLLGDVNGKTLLEHLKSKKWIPRLEAPPPNYPSSLPWYNEDSGLLYSPSEVYPLDTAVLVGAIKPVIKDQICENVRKHFGWDIIPCLDILLQQLQVVVDAWYKKKEDIDYSRVNQIVEATRSIYVSIQNLYHTSHGADRNQIISLEFPWLWNGDGFSFPDKMALKSSVTFDIKPHLFELPNCLQVVANLLEHCGVRKEFDDNDMLAVLEVIKANASTRCAKDEIQKDLQLSINIVEWFAGRDYCVPDAVKERILIPVQGDDKMLRLALRVNCTYCDNERLLDDQETQSMLGEGEECIHMTHGKVSRETARFLGIPPLSQTLAQPDPVGFEYEATGSNEPLTTRLRNILSDYTEGVSIFKELIQNADDAGATDIQFLIDWRSNDDLCKSLFCKEAESCQGPALWAYNNAVFTDDDLANINKLAGATKIEDTNKVGRFGLGFNSVYHLTDMPSFITRNFFVMFDPTTHHIPNLIKNKSQPGIKLDLKKNPKVLRMYADQFKVYDGIFGCDLENNSNFDATLFRFPLRSQSDAENSPICMTAYDRRKMEVLLESLQQHAETLLLFTQNIKKVEVYEIKNSNGNAADSELRMSIQVDEVQPLHPAKDLSFNTEQARQILKTGTEYLKAVKEQENCQVPLPSSYTAQVSCTYADGGQVKYQSDQVWAICSCISDGDAMYISTKPEGSKLGLMPCGSVAVKLTQAEDDGKYLLQEVEGEAFCYLPLHFKTNLPVHVNGGFIVESHRRDIRKHVDSDLGEPIEVQWNRILMSDTISKAYVILLEGLLQSGKISNPDQSYHLWPITYPGNLSSFQEVARGFYNRVVGKIDQHELPKVLLQEPYMNGDYNLSLTSSRIVEQGNKDLAQEALKIVNQRLSEEPESCSRTVNIGCEILQSFDTLELAEAIESMKISERMFHEEYLFPNLQSLPKEIRNGFVFDILLNDKWKFRNYLESLMKQCACIPTSPNGTRLSVPSQLIDPDSKALACLFDEGDGKFPFGEDYRKEECLLKLKQLGMAREKLLTEDVIERANSIKDLYEQDKEKALKRVSLLIGYLDSKWTKYQESELLDLCNIKFLPVLQKPQNHPLPWYENQDDLRPPSELYRTADQHLISTLAPILNDSDPKRGGSGYVPYDVVKLLKFKSDPDAQTVIQQLFNIIDSGKVSIRPDAEESTGHSLSPKSTYPSYDARQSTCKSIYRHLQDKLKNVERVFRYDHKIEEKIKIKDVESLRMLKESNRPLFLVEGTFIFPNVLSIDWWVSCPPYLYHIPEYTREFSPLLQACGVKKRFALQDFARALSQVEEDMHGEPLTEHLLGIVKRLLEQFEKKKEIPEEVLKTIYIPDESCILKAPEHLAYNDAPWMKTDDVKYTFVHPSLSRALVMKLGVKAVRSKKLDDYSTSEEFFIGEEFGANEDLTDRLKNILSDYPFGSTILKELVQNADDAGATEMHFVYDMRDHTKERLFSDTWENLQGPALCVYNDRPFTKKDVDGIRKLGVGGKRDVGEAIGQYGIGFNAVYHLTDCPSFITNNEDLIILDPHAKYAPGASRHSPGRRIKVPQLQSDFPNVLSPYLGEYFKLEQSTVFRLPLRDRSACAKSRISAKPCTDIEMMGLLREFKREMYLMPLFLNHLQKISVSKITEDGKLQEILSVCAEVEPEGIPQHKEFCQTVRSYATECKKNPERVLMMPEVSAIYYLNLKNSSGLQSKWLVTQKAGFSNLDSRELLNFRLDEMFKLILPQGGLAVMIESNLTEPQVSLWDTQAFCFLPLPIKTGLPFIINGHFTLASNRRNLCTEGSKKTWNDLIKKHVIAPAFVATLRCLKARIRSQDNVSLGIRIYNSMFPVPKIVTTDWKDVAVEMYKLVGSSNESLFPVSVPIAGHGDTHCLRHDLPRCACLSESNAYCQATSSLRWYSLPEVYFNEPVSEDGRAIPGLHYILREIGLPLTTLPSTVHEGFKESKIPTVMVSPASVITFLKGQAPAKPAVGRLPCNIVETPFHDVAHLKVVLHYCLEPFRILEQTKKLSDSDRKNLQSYIHKTPLCVTMDNKVRLFNNDEPVFVSEYASLIPQLEDTFVSQHIVEELDWLNTKAKDLCSATKCFDVDDLASNIDKVLPSTWTNSEQYVKWCPETENQPSEAWMKALWEFLVYTLSDQNRQKGTPLLKLSDWPLIPTSNKYLVPGSLRKTVLDPHCSYRSTSSVRETYAILNKLGCPMVCYDAVQCRSDEDEDIRRILQNYIADIARREDIIEVLFHFLQTNAWSGQLTSSECTTLLKYFQEDVGNICRNLNVKNKLKSLPIFTTIFGSPTSLDQHYNCCVLYGEIPDIEPDVWMGKCTLLMQDDSIIGIHKSLGVNCVQVDDVYLKYILPCFDQFSSKAKVHHLEYLRDNVELTEQLLNALFQLPFIPDQRGSHNLFRAKHFYDPTNKVFKEMLVKECFPPYPFNSAEWLEFLREIGLQQSVSERDFLDFAERVGKEDPSCAEKRAGLLIDLFFEKFQNLENNPGDTDSAYRYFQNAAFLKRIAEVNFIPSYQPEDKLTILHPSVKNSFTCFSKAVPLKYTKLVWTQAPILPSWADPLECIYDKAILERICKGLAIHMVPPLKVVIDHGKCIGMSAAQRNDDEVEEPTGPRSRESNMLVFDVMKAVYNFLMKNCQGSQPDASTNMCNGSNRTEMCAHCQQVVDSLSHIPFVFVDEGRLMVRADRVVFPGKLDGELIPYLCDLPCKLLVYAPLLELLGTQDKPNAMQYINVLKDIHTVNNGIAPKLHENDLKKASFAINGLFCLLNVASERICIANLSEHIYLLSDKHQLYKSTDLVFNDLERDKRLVAGLGCNFLAKYPFPQFANPKVFLECLPQGRRPVYLSSMVKENLIEIQPCIHHPQCSFEEDYQTLVTSDEFCRAIRLLLSKKEINITDKRQRRLHNLRNLQIRCVNGVNLQLVRLDNHLPIAKSEKRVPVYLSQEGQQDCIYLNHESCKGDFCVIIQFARIICHLLQGKVKDIFDNIQELLQCNIPGNIAAYLASKGCSSSEDTEEHALPEVGSKIPEERMLLLIQNPNHFFRRKEYVGYVLDPSSSSPTYIYAEVMREIKSPDTIKGDHKYNLKHMYEIDIGKEEPIVVTSLHLYKLSRQAQNLITEYDGPLTETDARNVPQSLEETFREISEFLERLFSDNTLTDDQHRWAIKRLYLQWHPDKNPGNEEFATEVFKYIRNELERLEGRTSGRMGSSGGSGSYGGSTYRYSSHYNEWNFEARAHRDRYRSWQERRNDHSTDSSHSGAGYTHDRYSSYSFSGMQPDISEGRRWFRQAKADFEAALKDLRSGEGGKSFEWVCFKCQQAVEKALKAGLYIKGGSFSFRSHCISSLASTLCMGESGLDIMDDVRVLVNLRCDHLRPRYPDMHARTTIPNDVYDAETATQILQHTKNIIETLETLLPVDSQLNLATIDEQQSTNAVTADIILFKQPVNNSIKEPTATAAELSNYNAWPL